MRDCIPEGWQKMNIGEACTLVNGRAFKPSDWTKTGTPIVRIQNLNDPNAEFNYCSGDVEDMHSIANLALLNTADNAALNNSTFDVKRNDIIQMDKRGQYIPFCTKMVFLKYYTPSAENQLHFWGQADRIAYIKAINDVLSDYIEPIVLEKEETK